jgi:hypothetical protein
MIERCLLCASRSRRNKEERDKVTMHSPLRSSFVDRVFFSFSFSFSFSADYSKTAKNAAHFPFFGFGGLLLLLKISNAALEHRVLLVCQH